jgi:putative phage-type endonuclease
MNKIDILQGSEEWLQARKGRITGTVLKGIMGTPKARQKALYEVIGERLTVGVDTEYENPMDRGTRLEPDAISAFEFETGKRVERTGLCEDEENPNIANSPDGLIGENEAIEVKCMGATNHVQMWLTNEIPDEYEWQAVQYFVVNPLLEKLYFVGYHPDIPIHPLHIIELSREEIESKIEKAKFAQKVFLEEVNAILSTIITI